MDKVKRYVVAGILVISHSAAGHFVIVVVKEVVAPIADTITLLEHIRH